MSAFFRGLKFSRRSRRLSQIKYYFSDDPPDPCHPRSILLFVSLCVFFVQLCATTVTQSFSKKL